MTEEKLELLMVNIESRIKVIIAMTLSENNESKEYFRGALDTLNRMKTDMLVVKNMPDDEIKKLLDELNG